MSLNLNNTFNKSIILIIFQCFLIKSINAQLISNFKSYFQSNYDQWHLSDSTRVFNPDNLYDYIDGAADSYLSYDFEELFVATYNGISKKYITVEIYRHKTPVQAFGIYALERPINGKFSNIGAQGYQEEGILNFLCDQYYIKIMSHDKTPETSSTIAKIAGDLAQKIDQKAEMPQPVFYFPKEGKIENSETFINNNFLGYEFLNSAFLASFGETDKTFRVFIIETKSFDEAKNMLTKYMTFVKQNFNGNEGQYTIKDPYNGEIKLEWKEKYIWGILNDKNVTIAKDYLKLVQDQLMSYKAI